MLDWIARGPAASGTVACANGAGLQHDRIEDQRDDAPTTPAPIFAARAFKQLIWGTPLPEVSIPPSQLPSSRLPSAVTEGHKVGLAPHMETPSTPNTRPSNLSPAKRAGILITPGTGGTRRKTVSFDRKSAILGPETMRFNQRSETPRVRPGEYPSPMPKGSTLEDLEARQNEVRHATASKKFKVAIEENLESIDDATTDLQEPRSKSGRYWKSEFDSYLVKSTHEMKKLAKKEQVAKKFAKDMDGTAVKLSEALRYEQSRVLALEKNVVANAAQLKIATISSDGNQPDEEKMALPLYDVAAEKNQTCGREFLHDSVHQAKLHGPEMNLSTTIARIEELEQANAQFQNQMAKLENMRKSNDFEIARLKAASGAASGAATQTSRLQFRSKTEAVMPDLGSDIWADAGQTLHPSDQAQAHSQKQVLDKSPLRPANVNVSLQAVHGMLKEEKMTSERRNAAMGRLEERRRNRSKTTRLQAAK